MEERTNVIEYKCPCCNAGLVFGSQTQQLKCEYCDNTFDIDTVRAYNESQNAQASEEFSWEDQENREWTEAERSALNAFRCVVSNYLRQN